MMEIITSTVYGHSIILISILFIDLLITKLDEADFLYHGILLFCVWLLVEFFFVLRSDNFWMGIVHLTASSLIVYVIFIPLSLICHKFGERARGDGAGFAYITPLMVYVYIFILTLVLKAFAVIWHYLISLV